MYHFPNIVTDRSHTTFFMYQAYGIIFFILIVTFLSVFFYSNAFAKEEQPKVYKYYTSIEIEHGDTLWSIARQYAGENYSSIQDYIDELKYMNNLTSDQIIEGHYLTIAYYSEEYK